MTAATSQKGAKALNGYETTFITRNELSEEALKTLQDKVKGVIGNFGGELVLEEDWGRRKLAYSIGRESRGHYTYLAYSGKHGVVAEIERNLRLSEHVLRFLTVNLAREFDGEVFKTQRAAAQAAAVKREAEREARREERMAERRMHAEERESRYRDRGEREYRGDRSSHSDSASGEGEN